MNIEEAIKVYNSLHDDENVKKFDEARHIILEKIDNQAPKREFYKSSIKYDYYIELPYEKLEFTSNGVGYRKHYHNAIGTGIGMKPTNYGLNFCRSLCKESKKEIIENIKEHIVKDNCTKKASDK